MENIMANAHKLNKWSELLFIGPVLSKGFSLD